MANLTELADRVEALAGPCREVDAEIVTIVKAGMRSPWFIAPPSFTGSLDAAMTLVPEGFNWQVGTQGTEGEAAWASVEALTYNPDTFNGISIYVDAATPALALCAAALRAREPLAP